MIFSKVFQHFKYIYDNDIRYLQGLRVFDPGTTFFFFLCH